jgi:polyhydroxyalkanoate synthase
MQAVDATAWRIWWTYADAVRRGQRALLDPFGLGPQTTPARLVWRSPAVDLLAFHDARARGPTLLIVPAPIKTWHIWDLVPEVSVVRRCLREGLRVYLMAWRWPADGQKTGLAQRTRARSAIWLSTNGVFTHHRAHVVLMRPPSMT